jgi:hypothetical protein
MISETRRYRRYPFVATAVLLLTSENMQQRITTLADNISLLGVGLRAYKPLDRGISTTVELAFMTMKGIREKDVIEGKIAWTARQEYHYYIGIAFDKEISRERNPKLYEHFVRVIQ